MTPPNIRILRPARPNFLLGAGLCFVVFCAVSPLLSASTPESAAPQELLAILPKAPSDWKLLSSLGRKDLTGGERPTTTATRAYEIPGKDGAPPLQLQIEAVDLISRTDLVDYLRGFTPDASGGLPVFRSGGLQGVIKEVSNQGVRLQAVVAGRVTLRVLASNISPNDFIEILKLLDWKVLVDGAANLPTKVNTKNEFIVGVFYEMDPKMSQAAVIPVYSPPDAAGQPPVEEISTPPTAPKGP
jgi:hypothetical protein